MKQTVINRLSDLEGKRDLETVEEAELQRQRQKQKDRDILWPIMSLLWPLSQVTEAETERQRPK